MTDLSGHSDDLLREVTAHYESSDEAERLLRTSGQLERARTQEILTRYLPPPPAVILDVGGGAGIYALWLAVLGYTVHLIDPTPKHVAQARAASQAQPAHPLASAEIGDARVLQWADASVDVVLLLGPLYHLPEREGRVQAWREACRVVRNGGLIVAAAISRFASVLDGLFSGFLDDPVFGRIAQEDVRSGQHRNPTQHPGYFTTAYFHHPEELEREIVDAGLQHVVTLPVEGIGCMLQNFEEHWQDAGRRERLLEVLRWLEGEPALRGATGHLLAVARKKM
jgi:ubiquinone/menaquinone biosynthesis C-methylase UbiE